jgi:hypothetical protein
VALPYLNFLVKAAACFKSSCQRARMCDREREESEWLRTAEYQMECSYICDIKTIKESQKESRGRQKSVSINFTLLLPSLFLYRTHCPLLSSPRFPRFTPKKKREREGKIPVAFRIFGAYLVEEKDL